MRTWLIGVSTGSARRQPADNLVAGGRQGLPVKAGIADPARTGPPQCSQFGRYRGHNGHQTDSPIRSRMIHLRNQAHLTPLPNFIAGGMRTRPVHPVSGRDLACSWTDEPQQSCIKIRSATTMPIGDARCSAAGRPTKFMLGGKSSRNWRH